MRLDDCYRLLDLDPRASAEEVKRAYRDLTKIWHPDRFAHDAALRTRAEEKLKAINEAYETICASSGGASAADFEPEVPSWRIRFRGREGWVAGLQAIVILVERGAIAEEAEVFDPGAGRWAALTEFPELRSALSRRRVRNNRSWALACAVIAILILLRRPTPGFLMIALVLVGLTAMFIARMRR